MDFVLEHQFNSHFIIISDLQCEQSETEGGIAVKMTDFGSSGWGRV